MFVDREDAAVKLAERLKGLDLHRPVVLAIPRGGVETGAVLARELHADLDVVLSRKLCAPYQPELALGAVSETGEVCIDRGIDGSAGASDEYLDQERRRQLREIERRKALFRAVKPKVPLAGRTVIVTDDGIATGSTMIAALRTIRGASPRELIVAVPVAPFDRLEVIRPLCDRIVCLDAPEMFWSIGQFYGDFSQVSDERAVGLLRESAGTVPPGPAPRRGRPSAASPSGGSPR